ncbi:hypothetical protein GCM10027168_08080 [Streptomyces capparidis]
MKNVAMPPLISRETVEPRALILKKRSRAFFGACGAGSGGLASTVAVAGVDIGRVLVRGVREGGSRGGPVAAHVLVGVARRFRGHPVLGGSYEYIRPTGNAFSMNKQGIERESGPGLCPTPPRLPAAPPARAARPTAPPPAARPARIGAPPLPCVR